jgi:hypothetical protein
MGPIQEIAASNSRSLITGEDPIGGMGHQRFLARACGIALFMSMALRDRIENGAGLRLLRPAPWR